MPRRTLPHVKVVRSKGRAYHYFDTGTLTEAGKPIRARLPDPKDPSYGATYASYLAGRTRRQNASSAMTLPRLIALYEKSPAYAKLAPKSRPSYDYAFRRLSALLPTAPAGEVEPYDMTRIMDGMADKPGAANLLLGVMGSIYAWGRSRRHVSNDPTKNVARLEMGEHEPWPLPILEKALTSSDDLLRLSAHLLYYTAQRIGDVCAMRWSDLHAGRLSIVQQKTGKALDIPLHAALAAELARTPRRGLLILARPDGRPITATVIRGRMKAHGDDFGVHIVPHGLRKNAVNALLEAGCSAAETAAVSGQSLQMVEHYAKARSQSKLGSAAVLKWERNAS